MNRKLLITATIATGLALICLLGYSIERTQWLFSLFETWAPAAWAAAVVVELAAVALIIGAGALSSLDSQARAWANRALVAVLSVQALANLTAGYLRGGRQALLLFGATDVPLPWIGGDARYAVAAALWFSVNLAVPGLILCLSKLAERLIAAASVASDAPLKAQVATLRAESAGLRTEAAALRNERDAALAESARLADAAAWAATLSAEAGDQLRTTQAESATAARELETLRTMVRDQSAAVDHLSAQNAALSASDGMDVRKVAQQFRDRGVPLRTIGDALGVSEKTIRNWTVDVRTNGHAVKA